jgi:hypothetical protein
LLGAHVEVFLAMAIMLLIEAMLPAQVQWRWFSGPDAAAADYAFWYLLSYVSMSMVAPFYVVCGFALYLNRRAQLEAWDIEIAFRRMREKHSSNTSLAVVFCTAVLLGSQLVHSPSVHATPGTEKPVSTPGGSAVSESRQLVGEVMQHKAFNERITYKIPKWFDNKEQASNQPTWMRWLLKWLKQLRDKDSDISKASLWFARVLEFLLWTALIIGVGLIAWRYRAFLRQWLPSRTQRRPKVWRMRRLASREGIDLDILPTLDDIGDNARTLWQQQEYRAAMALLYVASLYELAASDIPLDDSHTELESLELAKQHLNAEATQYFLDITMCWLRQAYAHSKPADREFFGFCDQWRDFIGSVHASAAARAVAMEHAAALASLNASQAGATHG